MEKGSWKDLAMADMVTKAVKSKMPGGILCLGGCYHHKQEGSSMSGRRAGWKALLPGANVNQAVEITNLRIGSQLLREQ